MISVTADLEIATLGRFEVRRNHDLLTGGNWSRRKVVDLFKLLLSAEQHRLHREQIQEILWPSSSIEQASNSFGKTLYLLRRALEPELAAGKGGSSLYVSLDRDTLMLIPGAIKIDADDFEAFTKQLQSRVRSRTGEELESQHTKLLDEFDSVLALYKGDYLPEDLYEDWSHRRRDRLRRIHSWLLENAAELAIASGKGQRASEYLLELLEGNSADESTHRQLMLVYARMGRRRDALNQYLLLRRALKEELRTTPLPETSELFKRIQMGQVPVDLREAGPVSTTVMGAINRAPTEESHATASEGAINRAPTTTEGRSISQALQESRSEGEGQQTAPEEIVTLSSPRQLDPDRILKAELVGREEEIARMQRALAQARGGQRRVLFISGEPGIGKSRLAREFTHWGEGRQQATVLWGYCYEMSGLLPYQPIADAITSHLRTSAINQAPTEKLRTMLGESAVYLAKIVPELRLKLPDLPDLPPESLGPEMERRQLYNAVARYFNALAAEGPLIVILDDLQWADAATLHLLNYLTLQSAGNPFDAESMTDKDVPLFLLLFRTGEVHEAHPLRGLIAGLARQGIGEELRLQRLSEEQVHQLLVNMAGHSVGPIFAGEIYRHTEGNPFFVGEAVRSLILEGKVVWTGERWQSTVKVSELEIPQSVRLLIERRLVNLSPECRITLTLAAVMGRQFSSALLSQAHTMTEDIIAEHIDTAIQLQLLATLDALSGKTSVTRSIGDTEHEIEEGQAVLSPYYQRDLDLAFTHDKIREVLYQWLNPLRRRVLHRQVAQALEDRYGRDKSRPYSQLAYHYQMAEDYGKAVEYLLKAAEQASAVYAFVDAGEYVKTALDLLVGDGDRPLRATLLYQLANIYLYTGRLNDAVQAGLASATLWRDLDDPVKQAEAYLWVAFCVHWQGKETDAIKYIHSALECLETHQDQMALLAKAYAQWGLAATIMGEAPEALEKLRHADIFHEQVGGNDPFVLVVSSWALAWCAFLIESPQKMLEVALQAVEVCRKASKPDWEPMMNYSAAWAYMQLGRLAEGEQAAQAALRGAQQHNVVAAQGWAYLVMAFVAISAGNWEDAKQFANKSYVIGEMLHDADLQARVLWSRSVCAGWEGNWEQAVTDVLAALELARKDGEISMIYPHLLVQAARAYFFTGEPEQAQTRLDEAMQMAQDRHYRQLPAIAQRLQGRIWQAQNRFEEALPCFERSLVELQAIDDVVEYARTEEAFGVFFIARNREGDAERGQKLFERARETFRRLGVNG